MNKKQSKIAKKLKRMNKLRTLVLPIEIAGPDDMTILIGADPTIAHTFFIEAISPVGEMTLTGAPAAAILDLLQTFYDVYGPDSFHSPDLSLDSLPSLLKRGTNKNEEDSTGKRAKTTVSKVFNT